MFRLVVTAGVLAGLYGVLLGGQAEGVVSHRVQDVEAFLDVCSASRCPRRYSPADGLRASRRPTGRGNMSST